jgi:hypothetical protein
MTALTDTFTHLASRTRRDELTARVAAFKGDLLTLEREYGDKVQAARAFTDPHLTAEGLDAKRTELVAQAGAQIGPRLDRLTELLDIAVTDLNAAAQAARPALNWSDAASIQRAQVKWDQARMLLTKGVPIRDVIANADVDTLLALREWGPSWLDAEAYQATDQGLAGFTPTDHAAFERTIDQRIANVAGGDTAAALHAANDATATAAYAAPVVRQLRADLSGIRGGNTTMGAAIEATFAEQAARATWPAPADPAVQAADTLTNV